MHKSRQQLAVIAKVSEDPTQTCHQVVVTQSKADGACPLDETLAELAKKGEKAWADVPDPTTWVDDLRGS